MYMCAVHRRWHQVINNAMLKKCVYSVAVIMWWLYKAQTKPEPWQHNRHRTKKQAGWCCDCNCIPESFFKLQISPRPVCRIYSTALSSSSVWWQAAAYLSYSWMHYKLRKAQTVTTCRVSLDSLTYQESCSSCWYISLQKESQFLVLAVVL